jgi:hypothetical protein
LTGTFVSYLKGCLAWLLLVEAKAVAQQQIVEAMLEDSDPSILISYIQMPHPFFFKHYQSFQITLIYQEINLCPTHVGL